MSTGMTTMSRKNWSLTQALERVEGDRELLRELIGIYLDEIPQLRTELQAAVAWGEADAVRRLAHTIKGAVLNFAAEAAGQRALELEMIGRRGDLSQAATVLLELNEELDRLTRAMTAAMALEG